MQTTFKSNLEGYTTQISTEKNTEEYRKLEAQAAKAAQEIEGSGTNKLAIELENGDEEEAFSAVVRGKGGMYFHGIIFSGESGMVYQSGRARKYQKSPGQIQFHGISFLKKFFSVKLILFYKNRIRKW